jgi:hypothetical protein
MDEGWTRWILRQYANEFATSSLSDGDIRGGNLKAKYDCVIIPAQGAQQILNGLSADRYPAELSGGMGKAGVESLKKFVEDGGTVVTLNDASMFAISQLGAPVRNALEGVSNRDFYCPGSILRIKLDPDNPINRGAATLESSRDSAIAWFEGGPALEPTAPNARVVARFADAKDLLLSGWLLGADKIAGRGAIVEVTQGKGRIVMFAFRPQYRGQSIATLPFLFNAIRMSAAGGGGPTSN